MNAAETSASSAMADCTPLAVVSRSVMTAEIDTFINDVSTTRTNIAAASRTISRRLPEPSGPASFAGPVLMAPSSAPVPRPAASSRFQTASSRTLGIARTVTHSAVPWQAGS